MLPLARKPPERLVGAFFLDFVYPAAGDFFYPGCRGVTGW
jgi:hypothetical protein